MSKNGYVRCEFMSPNSGLQCERWFEGPDEWPMDSDGNRLSVFCIEHQKGVLESNKPTIIEEQNQERIQCYRMTLDELDSHIAGIETIIEEQKRLFFTARAVKMERLQNLSEDERKERLKYKIKKSDVPGTKTPTPSLKADPVGHIAKKLGGADAKQRAMDLMTMDPDEFIKKYQAKKDQKKEENQ